MKAGQQTISQQQKAAQAQALNKGKGVIQNINNHAEEERARKMKENAQKEVDAQRHAQAENYRKNFQAAQTMNNAEAQRAQKMKENAQKEVQDQKERQKEQRLSGRSEAEQKAKKNNSESEKVKQVVDEVIQNKFSKDITLEDYAKKYNIEPDRLAIGVYESTGWLLPSNTVDYGNDYANPKIKKKG